MNFFLKIIIILAVVLFGLSMIFSNLLGDKVLDNVYIFRIKNNTPDTLYIKKPYSEDNIYTETVEIKGEQFIKIDPYLDSDFYSEHSMSVNYRKDALLQWSNINDTLIGYSNRKSGAFKFVFGIKDKCKVEEDEHSLVCTRIIDK